MTAKASLVTAKARLAYANANAAMDAENLLRCYRCNEDKPRDECRIVNQQKVNINPTNVPFVICKDCGSGAAKITRLLNENPNLREVYTTLSKNDFLQEFKGQHISAMKAHLEQMLETAASSVAISMFGSSSAWLDEIDIREKYKNKPEQRDHLLTSARTVEHPTRNCTLYEDVEYKAVETNESKHEVIKRMRASAEEQSKLSNKAKVKGEHLEEETEEGVPKPKRRAAEKELTTAQTTNFQKLSKRIEATTEKLVELLAKTRLQQYVEFVPAPYVDAAERTVVESKAAHATVELSLTEGWRGAAKAIGTDAKKAIDASVSNADRLETFIKQRDDMPMCA